MDLDSSNHMTSHGEWFKDMKTLQNPGYVEIGDDTMHPIAHTGNVPLTLQDGNVKYLADIFHVPNITKNLGKWLSRVCRCGLMQMDYM